jgi:HAD superfamily hydrolase (TIGR01509 family)
VPPVAGFIFDLDGTLVETALDFGAMRREMGLPDGLPLLEAFAGLDAAMEARCRAILDRHELEGAERATLLPGVAGFLETLDGLGLRRAVFTRNSRTGTRLALERCGLFFEDVVTRDDGPPKPDPWAIFRLCEGWGIAPAEVAVVGDYRFDMEAGRRAGCRTVLYTRGRPAEGLPGAELADFSLDCFHSAEELLAALRR